MASGRQHGDKSEEYWQDFLTHPDSMMRVGRHFLSRLPNSPRCQLCAAPFTGWGGGVMKLIGKEQSQSSPSMCNSCEKILLKHHGGAEVQGAMLFADIRGSTALAERMSPSEFRGSARPLLRRRLERRLRARRDARQVRR